MIITTGYSENTYNGRNESLEDKQVVSLKYDALGESGSY